MRHKIESLAYQLWEQSGSPQGRDMEFWLQAEAQLAVPPVEAKVPAKPKAAPKPKPKAEGKPKVAAKKAAKV